MSDHDSLLLTFSYDDDPPFDTGATTIERVMLQHEVESFFAFEADLLDQWRYRRWLDLVTSDVRYWMPIRRNVKHGDWKRERTSELEELAWFDENKTTLTARADQLESGVHWVEEPRSRVTHITTNTRIVLVRPSVDNKREVVTRSRFIVYRNHLDDEESLFIGKRGDVLRSVDESESDGLPLWRLARRVLLLDQSV